MHKTTEPAWLPTATPTPRQLEYQDWEMGLFIHFGIRTFYEGHKDLDRRPMPPEAFTPAAFDAQQWARTAREAGMRYIVLTAKHHDGFCNWPSAYTRYSVAASPWKAGKGDVVREFVDACREYDLKIGLYYSPADVDSPVYQDERAYDDYFIDQIGELLSNYGQIDMVWFDGCGSEGHTYDWPRIIGEIRSMQPRILVFGGADPDYGWMGNESGLAPVPNWNTVSHMPISILTSERASLGAGEPRWVPAECNARMRMNNWFYSDGDEATVKGVHELMGLYHYSVGRGRNLLLNVGPDRRGLLPDRDAQSLLQFGAEIRRRFGDALVTQGDFTRQDSTWTYTPPLPGIWTDHVILQEDLTSGEHVRRFRIQAFPTHYGEPITVFEGYNIGHKAICGFPMLCAKKLRIEVLEADGPVELPIIQVFNTSGEETARV
jgi:alpha-L-fucosidase